MADATLIEWELAAWLEALPACTAVSAKVYPWGRAPQSTATRPFVLYHRVSGGRLRSLAGPSGVSHPRIQIDVVGRDYLVVRRLSAAIREALEDLAAGSELVAGGKLVQVAMVNDERDADDTDPDQEPKHGDEQTEHRAMIDVTIWFAEE